ncbi:MAG: hypothetical protein ACE5PV_12405 [Candidatus Poribacteria bacterium]
MKMKKAEVWETVVIILSILTLWPVVWWYNSKQDVPPLYFILVLLPILAVLAYIMSRRIKRLRQAMRDSKNRRWPFPF